MVYILIHKKNKITIEDIEKFHAEYEKIHPFQDGNGRIIIFKECLKNGIIPLIIEDNHKGIYYDALNKAQTNKRLIIKK